MLLVGKEWGFVNPKSASLLFEGIWTWTQVSKDKREFTQLPLKLLMENAKFSPLVSDISGAWVAVPFLETSASDAPWHLDVGKH